VTFRFYIADSRSSLAWRTSGDPARSPLLSTCANQAVDLPLSGKLQSNLIRASDSWRGCRKYNYTISTKRLFDAVERRGNIGRRVAALVLPISNRPRVTSSCAGKIGLREPGEHTSGPNLASRDNVTHEQNLYTILEGPRTISEFEQNKKRQLEETILSLFWPYLVAISLAIQFTKALATIRGFSDSKA
jgi:hypothetical protein